MNPGMPLHLAPKGKKKVQVQTEDQIAVQTVQRPSHGPNRRPIVVKIAVQTEDPQTAVQTAVQTEIFKKRN